jgi:glycosyltransferase involved in cell wall biosynthesis
MKLPEGVIKAGFVPEKEFDREISALSCVVVPVRYGTGRQNKIMRSWACSVPVVGTPYSARGVYGKHGLNMLIGHTPFSFQEAIVKLKNTPGLAKNSLRAA